MEFMTVTEASIKWGIDVKKIMLLCSENKIENIKKVENVWMIPSNTMNPFCTIKHDSVKPFLKWAGGKGQLLKEIEKYYPFFDKKITKYAEPFVGGGAVLFDILSRYSLEKVYLSDINKELINTYCCIRDNIDELIELLREYQLEYISLDVLKRREYYLRKRERFNYLKIDLNNEDNIEKAALMIFLNKTCFNGLYRVNKKGLFNVPMGNYKKPLICDDRNLRAV